MESEPLTVKRQLTYVSPSLVQTAVQPPTQPPEHPAAKHLPKLINRAKTVATVETSGEAELSTDFMG